MDRNKKLLYHVIIHSVVPIMMGACIYILFRPDTYISQWIYRLFDMSLQSKKLRELLPFWLLAFLCNFACDILWAYSLTFAIYIIFVNSPINILFIFVVSIVFEAGIEFMQLACILPGTFDWLDISLEICATAIASLEIKNIRRKTHESF